MLNKKKTILLILIVFSLFMIMSSVSAADRDLTLTPASDFKNMIDKYQDDGLLPSDKLTVTLDSDGLEFVLNSTNTNIEISKNVIIKSGMSKNAVINLNGSGRAFNVTSTGNLTLINISIINGNIDYYGGAIYNKEGCVNLTGCIFSNNRATTYYYGGAISNDRGNVTLDDCIFTSNTAYGGGVIFNNGNLSITSCNFTNNSNNNNYGGGVIYNAATANLTATDCNFTNNRAIYNNGGAIYNNGGRVNLTRCTFLNNKAEVNYAGAIYNYGANGILTLDTCNFVNNTSINYGGAIYNQGARVTIIGCNFTNNSAPTGGAIFNTIGSVNLTNCNFTNNSADDMGGAIFNTIGSVNLTNCNFTNNSADDRGGAIYNNRSSVNLDNCIFTDNNATNCGGVINNYEGNASFTDCKFINNLVGIGGDGGVIFNSGNVTLTDCNFKNNTGYGGAVIFNWGDNASLVANTCNFTENNVTGYDGGVIYNYNSSVDLTDCCFDNNFAIRNGGAIFIENGIVNLTNCNFTNNSATDNGGAIFIKKGSVNLTSCNFRYNSAIFNESSMGGAIYNNNSATLTLDICTFTNNSGGSAGAIYNWGNLVIYTCNFTNNSATDWAGGAIVNYGDSNLTVNACIFTNNSATQNYGGAIYNLGGRVNLTVCNFINNKASAGGAITNDWGSFNLSGCIFIGNNARRGGAILSWGDDSILNVSFSVFDNNIGSSTIDTDTGNYYLNDNFFYWVNPILSNSTYMNELKLNITNSPDSITSFYYLNVTNNTVDNQGDTLTIRSQLLHSGGTVDDSRLPDANITLMYNDKINSTFSYKSDRTVSLELQSSSNTIELCTDYSKIYELQVLLNKLDSYIILTHVSRYTGEPAQLIANLTNGTDPIVGATILFYVNDIYIGNNTTNALGIATYNHTSTSIFIYSAFFGGNDQYNETKSINARMTFAPRPNSAGLDSLINLINGLKPSDYTPASWSELQGTLIVIKNLIATTNDITQEQINNYISLLNAAKNKLVISVNKVNTNLVITTFKPLFNKATNIKVTAKDINGKLLANKLLTLYINGKPIKVLKTNNDGVVNFKYIFKTRKAHKIVAMLTEDSTHKSSNSITLSLTPKDKTTLNLAKVKASFKKTATFKATLKNSKNKAFANKVVKFYANKKLLGQVKTDAKGVATLTKVVPIKGTVSFIARYAGDKNNHDIDATRKIKVK